jgi:hypothetical protein
MPSTAMAEERSLPQRIKAARLNHSLLAPPRMYHVRTSYLSTQDDVSYPDSEHELVLWSSLGVETRELGDELVPSVDRYLRISPLWRLARRISILFHPA